MYNFNAVKILSLSRTKNSTDIILLRVILEKLPNKTRAWQGTSGDTSHGAIYRSAHSLYLGPKQTVTL